MPEIRGTFVGAITEIEAAAHRGVTAACEYVLAEADQRAPLETGALVRSGDYDVETSDDGNAEGSVYYDTVYARRQHEELTWQHDPGREAKWLERTCNREANRIGQIIGQTIRAVMS